MHAQQLVWIGPAGVISKEMGCCCGWVLASLLLPKVGSLLKGGLLLRGSLLLKVVFCYQPLAQGELLLKVGSC